MFLSCPLYPEVGLQKGIPPGPILILNSRPYVQKKKTKPTLYIRVAGLEVRGKVRWLLAWSKVRIMAKRR
jgi:hypothetical protein